MTGLIYVVIIGLWAAVLIPIWLKRQDQVSEFRSTARFSSAMKSLGDHADRVDRANSESDRQLRHDREFTSPRDRARVKAAKRRSMVLATLTSITALGLIGTVMGFVPAFIAIAAGILLVAFLVTTMLTSSKRAQAPARSASSISTSKRAYREFHEVAEVREPRIDQRPRNRAERQVAELDEFAKWDPWDEEVSGWDAVPQTLPSYITSPRATAIPRNIERNGDWSGESMLDLVNKAQQGRVANVTDETAEIPIIRANSSYQARAVNE